jgi:hypothetical protein
MSRRPNIELRLLRFESGMHPGMCGPINIFHFPGKEPPAVFLETNFAILEVTHPAEVTAYIDTVDLIRSAALDPAATTAHLSRLAEKLRP